MSDNISRQAALDAASYETFECYEARKAIRALPSTDRKGHWIDRIEEIEFHVIQKLGAYEDIGTPNECRKAMEFWKENHDGKVSED